jgi:phosphoribosyl 1,2-cyclic phosphodiesterase
MNSNSESATFFVRINGVLPDSSGPRGEEGKAHTSISVFSEGFHLLIDAGDGIADSVKKGASDLGYKGEPDAILVTHSRGEHTSDLSSFSGKIFCTSECAAQITKEFPQVDKSRFATAVIPSQSFDVGPFSIVPVAANNNTGDNPGFPGSVIYVVRAGNRKVIAGWDFISLQNVSADLMWNPDLLVLGTGTYNDHPSTGMISITEAYHLVKVWNAKDCYILHYSGEMDKEDAKNQWHRGPTGPLSPEELQKTINDYLRMSGQEGKVSIKVARQGMVWRPAQATTDETTMQEDRSPVGNKIEIEALEKYIFGMEKMQGNKLMFVLEDSINRQESEFVNPKSKSSEGNSLHADGIKSIMMKGPELNLTISSTTVKVEIVKGKKAIFADDIRVNERDAKKLSRYIKENF